MADTKTTALTANTTPADADIMPMVDDPGGTPATQKMTLATLKTFVQASLGARTSSFSSSANTGTSTALVSVVGGIANTKGSYVELIASTSHDAETLILTIPSGTFLSGANTATLLDIATGAAASEVDLLSNLAIGGWSIRMPIVIPIHIASGTRISARVQGAEASKTISVVASLRSTGDNQAVPTACTSYGITTGISGGVSLTAPGSTNTKAAYTQITASTSSAHTRLLVLVHTSQSNATASTGLIDIATGGAGSETVIIPDIHFALTATEEIYSAGAAMAFTVAVPNATRLSARYQSTSTAAGAQPKVALYGLT